MTCVRHIVIHGKNKASAIVVFILVTICSGITLVCLVFVGLVLILVFVGLLVIFGVIGFVVGHHLLRPPIFCQTSLQWTADLWLPSPQDDENLLSARTQTKLPRPVFPWRPLDPWISNRL